MFEWITTADGWIALVTLAALEIVLGIDNIIFISILAGKLPEHQQAKARNIGLILAMGTRLLLLFSLSWVMSLTNNLFTILNQGISGRDLILLSGGLFLLAKATTEIHHKLEGQDGEDNTKVAASYAGVLIQIMLLDIVFSLDSVITAVGMADHISIMVIAVIVSVGIMLLAAGSVSDFVQKHPTVKMLALSFLLLIGLSLFMEGLDKHIEKGYIYFAMGFSVMVELLNLKAKRRSVKPVQLRERLRGAESL
ncbi:MAG: TerC family protein [Myxococcales bacterium]|nr:TerC family protein [Myxococcales bacterium]